MRLALVQALHAANLTVLCRVSVDHQGLHGVEALRGPGVQALGLRRCGCVRRISGSLQPILSLNRVNYFLRDRKFRMEYLLAIIFVVLQNNWLITLDLQDVYLHVPVLPAHQKFLKRGNEVKVSVSRTGEWGYNEVKGSVSRTGEWRYKEVKGSVSRTGEWRYKEVKGNVSHTGEWGYNEVKGSVSRTGEWRYNEVKGSVSRTGEWRYEEVKGSVSRTGEWRYNEVKVSVSHTGEWRYNEVKVSVSHTGEWRYKEVKGSVSRTGEWRYKEVKGSVSRTGEWRYNEVKVSVSHTGEWRYEEVKGSVSHTGEWGYNEVKGSVSRTGEWRYNEVKGSVSHTGEWRYNEVKGSVSRTGEWRYKEVKGSVSHTGDWRYNEVKGSVSHTGEWRYNEVKGSVSHTGEWRYKEVKGSVSRTGEWGYNEVKGSVSRTGEWRYEEVKGSVSRTGEWRYNEVKMNVSRTGEWRYNEVKEEESDENTNPDEYSADSLYDPYNQKTTQVVFEYRSGRKVARLREPRDLYGVSSASFLQPPRWPHECEVLKERVQHIEWNPPAPEPMYKPTGLEQEPACKDPTNGKVIYLVNEGGKGPFFMCSRVGGNRSPLRQVAPLSCEASKTTLIFEARFESGNLQKVVQVGDYDYQLTLRTDLYTNRHIQWYYFRVKNTRAGVPYRFTIVNLMKPTSLYSHGMRPLMYSEVEASTRKIGWYRIGEEIKYYRNNLGQGDQSYFSLSWTFRFPHSMDTCYFAHCYPYTYSKLQDYLSDIASDPERSKYCKIRVLCHSLAGNIVYILTITNPSTEEPKKKKQAVVVTARVHPGETNSSWVMKGFLDYILSSRNDAFQLRDQFVFKVVPMLNPDGVIVGNYRCSLAGRDLNRNYKSRLKDSFPSIWFTRKMIKRVMEEREILLYCDLHGHSRKQNVFMYGCNGSQAKDRHLYERLFPLLLSKNSPEMFSFPACKFQVQKSKEGTGRVVMWKMGIRNSFTLEATFCGSTLGTRHGTHFSTKDLESVGAHFCDALLDYSDPEQTKCYLYLKELNEILKQRFVFNHEKAHLDSKTFLNDVLSDLDSSTSGSDSSDSNGPPAHQMELATKFKPREKMLKSKRERNSHRKQLVLNIKQEQPMVFIHIPYCAGMYDRPPRSSFPPAVCLNSCLQAAST
ncbi:cytosolic carboxypeptidase 3 [Rhinophrynus dorsalis]